MASFYSAESRCRKGLAWVISFGGMEWGLHNQRIMGAALDVQTWLRLQDAWSSRFRVYGLGVLFDWVLAFLEAHMEPCRSPSPPDWKSNHFSLRVLSPAGYRKNIPKYDHYCSEATKSQRTIGDMKKSISSKHLQTSSGIGLLVQKIWLDCSPHSTIPVSGALPQILPIQCLSKYNAFDKLHPCPSSQDWGLEPSSPAHSVGMQLLRAQRPWQAGYILHRHIEPSIRAC